MLHILRSGCRCCSLREEVVGITWILLKDTVEALSILTEERIVKSPILQTMLSMHAHTRIVCLLLESASIEINHSSVFLLIVPQIS